MTNGDRHKRAEAIRQKLVARVNVAAQVGEEGPLIGRPTGFVSTGNPMIDFLIGRPGIPLGAITLLVGAYGTGKTTLCYQIAAQTQALGGQIVYFDTEGRFDFDRAKQVGVNTDEFILVQPETLEDTYKAARQTLAVARDEVEEDDIVVVFVDSAAGAALKEDLEGDGSAVGAYSRLLSDEMKILPGLVHRKRIGLVLTAQPRMKIEFGRWGQPGTTWMGERALGHAAQTVLLLEEQQKIGDDPNSPTGYRIQVTLKDTRIAGKARRGWRRTVDFYNDTGFDYWGSVADVLTDPQVKLLKYNNGWYYWKDEKPFRRKDIATKMEEWPPLTEALAQLLQGGPLEEEDAEGIGETTK